MDEKSDQLQVQNGANTEGNSIAPKSVSNNILRKIRHQMEFYFSNSNLQRDRLLGQLVKENEDGYVDLSIFLTFNKLQALTTDINDIKKAIEYSKVLVLNEDGNQIHRKVPFDPSEDSKCDERTIYIERIPANADDVYVRNIFRQFGRITYVGIPRFKNSHKTKGFAFVEFELEESVQKACEFFKKKDQETEESEKTEDDDDDRKKVRGTRKRSLESEDSLKSAEGKKRRQTDSERTSEKVSKGASDSDHKPGTSRDGEGRKHLSKKRKRLNSESDSSPKKGKTSLVSVSSSDIESEVVKKEHDSSADEGNAMKKKPFSEVKSDSEGPQPSKKLCISEDEDRQVSKDSHEKDTKSKVTENTEEGELKVTEDEASAEKMEKKHRKRRKKVHEKLQLRVITKLEWKIYRNKYLTMQKKTLSCLKKMLFLAQQHQSECEKMLSCTTEELYGDTNDESVTDTKDIKPSTGIQFHPNTIIKVKLNESPACIKSLIVDVKSRGEIAFVDVSNPKELFVRFRNDQSAAKCLEENSFNHLGTCELVTGEAESEYWEKIKTDREAHRSRPKQHKRGRDKILAKAAEMMKQKNTHLHFDIT